MEVIVHNDIKLLRESTNRMRKKHFPSISKTTNEALDKLFETHIKTNIEKFCFDNRRKKLFC